MRRINFRMLVGLILVFGTPALLAVLLSPLSSSAVDPLNPGYGDAFANGLFVLCLGGIAMVGGAILLWGSKRR